VAWSIEGPVNSNTFIVSGTTAVLTGLAVVRGGCPAAWRRTPPRVPALQLCRSAAPIFVRPRTGLMVLSLRPSLFKLSRRQLAMPVRTPRRWRPHSVVEQHDQRPVALQAVQAGLRGGVEDDSCATWPESCLMFAPLTRIRPWRRRAPSSQTGRILRTETADRL
jgi:hypothetical protein